MVKNPSCNAGDMGLIPSPGRYHMLQSNYACVPQLLSLQSRTCEPQLLIQRVATTEIHMPRARALHQEMGSEKPINQRKEQPLSHN